MRPAESLKEKASWWKGDRPVQFQKPESCVEVGSGVPNHYNTKREFYILCNFTIAFILWENKIKISSCLVILSAGRIVSDSRSIEELLKCERGASGGHQFLFMDGNILHRDISANNTIIAHPRPRRSTAPRACS